MLLDSDIKLYWNITREQYNEIIKKKCYQCKTNNNITVRKINNKNKPLCFDCAKKHKSIKDDNYIQKKNRKGFYKYHDLV